MAALPRRLTINHFLWLCAVMPVFVVPPIASLIFGIASMCREKNVPPNIHAEWLAIISFLNIVLSLLLLYKLHFSPYEVMAFIRDTLHWLLGSIFHFAPAGHQAPRVVPI
jgi:hypothetical protein